MTTSFDTPRVLGHHNPFASFQDTTDDPLASGPRTAGHGGSSASATDPWSSYYNPPIPSTSSSNQSSIAGLSGVIDEDAIPNIYVRAWNAASTSSSSTSFGSTHNTGNTVSLAVLQKVLSNCAGLSAGETEKIINLVSSTSSNLASSYTQTTSGNATSPTSPFRAYGGNNTINTTTGNGRITRLEFYIALALTALAQQKEALSMQAVSSLKGNLPVPTLDLSALQASGGSTLSQRPGNTRNPSSPTTPYRSHKMSIGSSNDPWNAGSNGGVSHHAPASSSTPRATPHAEGSGNDPFRTSPSAHTVSQPPMYSPPRAARTTENGYSHFPSFNENDDDLDTSAPNSEYTNRNITGESSNSNLLSLPPFHSSSRLNDELEKIIIIREDELKGNFLNRYTCYRVINEREKVEVLRRYSDWSVLHDYLEIRYAGRVRLSLPPKRMGISSRHVHIASDGQFLERRRRGLMRYIEFIANHPIMKHDKAVKAFLTETMEFQVWRKIHLSSLTIDVSLNDEASLIGKLTTSQESLIPTSFESILTTLRESLPGLIDSLTRLCALIERINYRTEQNSSDLVRARLALDSFGEIYKGLSNGGHHAGRPKEIEEETLIFNRDILKLSENIGNIAELQESNTNGRVEDLERDLKLQRDLWRSLFSLLNKYESKLKHDNIDKIKKKIETSQNRYSTLNNTTPNQTRKMKEEEEMKRIITQIEDDQNEIERLLNKRAFFKWSITGEIRFIWRLSTLMRVVASDWTMRENKHYAGISQICAHLEDALAVSQ